MKVLFAVNDERTSATIVKKYQKQYKEIISYKNVYYFNAILKELQKDKTYDRIVISEDLETFTSTSWEQRDKFIFEKLDNISDEASNSELIPIILICAERRTKSEPILVKLFSIGVYNAILGNDKSFDEICRLIYKPRSKKEAKIYYKIDSDEVKYEVALGDDEVSEDEMQNILTHFKRLGKNTDKYVESFKNIVTQYNDAQLKVIASMLPGNVQQELSRNSKEFQKIIGTGKSSQIVDETQERGNKKEQRNPAAKKGTIEKLISSGTPKHKSNKEVVVPTALNKNTIKKVTSVKSKIEPVQEIEEIEEIQPIIEEKPKKRGRPRKNPVQEEQVKEEEVQEEILQEKPKKRGRPRKKQEPLVEEDEPIQEMINGYEEEEQSLLPGFEEEYEEDEDETILPGFDEGNDDEDEYDEEYDEDEYDDENTLLPGFDEDDEIPFNNNINYRKQTMTKDNSSYRKNDIKNEELKINNNMSAMRKYDEDEYEITEEEFERLLSSDKKIVTFIGTSKNGTSFMVNNVAKMLSSMGIDTAILDVTQNKNSYYIYTNNEEELRQISNDTMEDLENGRPNGIKIDENLTVYTGVPHQMQEDYNPGKVLETLVKTHSAILIDTDYLTPKEYFAKAQEIYLVQSMDILTIQPLTAFLRDLKSKKILDERNIRIILNKVVKVKGVSSRSIIAGMSCYNSPDMSVMDDLFDKNVVKFIEVPFDEQVYIKYLTGIIDCEVNLNGYNKEFIQILRNLAETVYPLLPNNTSSKKQKKGKNKKEDNYSNVFSSSTNNTLKNMKKKY